MTDQPVYWVGLLICALLVAAGLMQLSARGRLFCFSAALLIAPALIVADNWENEVILELRDRPELTLSALSAAIALLLGFGLLLHRRPVLVAPLLIGALPFRVPVELGGSTTNLLLPLYALIAAALVAAWIGLGEREERAEQVGTGWLRLIGAALGAYLVLYVLQSAYTADLSTAIENVCFFLVPFAALYFLLTEVRWDAAVLRRVLIVLVAEGLLFALVGFVQFARGELFWNDKVIAGNEAHAYFRVNSLFWDPNILGRYMAVTLTAVAALVAFGRDRRQLIAAAIGFAVMLVALTLTFSQSSSLALIAGVLVLVAARWGIARGLGAGLAAGLALVAALALIGGGGLTSETSGRSGLIDGGLELAAERPLQGFGSASFPDEFGARFGDGEGIAVESHTEPVTVLAEQGLVGAGAYAALLAITIGGLLAASGLRWAGPATGRPLALALLAVYAVMVVHSFGYAAFLIDPITWALLALAAAALGPAPRTSVEPATEPARQPAA